MILTRSCKILLKVILLPTIGLIYCKKFETHLFGFIFNTYIIECNIINIIKTIGLINLPIMNCIIKYKSNLINLYKKRIYLSNHVFH